MAAFEYPGLIVNPNYVMSKIQDKPRLSLPRVSNDPELAMPIVKSPIVPLFLNVGYLFKCHASYTVTAHSKYSHYLN